MQNIINVLVVDDLDLVRTGIKYMLADVDGIKVVGEAKNGKEAKEKLQELSPGVVILDLKLPDVDAKEITEEILQINPAVKILILTAYDDDVYPTQLLEAGAKGYVTKNENADELVEAIRSVYEGRRYISPHVAQNLLLKGKGSVDVKPFSKLSDRELEVALMISQGYKATEIAEKLNLSGKTINSYRYRIFDKLNIDGDVQLAMLAIRHGLVPMPTPAAPAAA
jgi:two-component system invasion response regulator UvrY